MYKTRSRNTLENDCLLVRSNAFRSISGQCLLTLMLIKAHITPRYDDASHSLFISCSFSGPSHPTSLQVSFKRAFKLFKTRENQDGFLCLTRRLLSHRIIPRAASATPSSVEVMKSWRTRPYEFGKVPGKIRRCLVNGMVFFILADQVSRVKAILPWRTFWGV